MILIVWIRIFFVLNIFNVMWKGMKYLGILKYFKNIIKIIVILLIILLCYDIIV